MVLNIANNVIATCSNLVMVTGDCITLLLPDHVEMPADMCACSDVQEPTFCPSGNWLQLQIMPSDANIH